ncbi:MAG TPA: glycosyltransferase family 4 protein [Acidimicrobiales bacterium]|nr:glycosyltransferase family 4 protein [Acidimicrobiales bacterium]
MNIAVLSSHPIQYQAPLFRALAARPGVRLTALFCHDHGVRPSHDPGFGQAIQFDTPLLEGYDHRFLPNLAPRPSIGPTGMFNPAIVSSLLDGEFDALIVHGYTSPTTILGLGGPRRRTRVLFRGESNLVIERSMARRATKRLFLRALFSRVDHFLSIGTLNTEYLEHYGVDVSRITMAPYSVDNKYFVQESAAARANPAPTRRRLGIPADGVVFVSSGKLIPRKRPLDLLHAFAQSVVRTTSTIVYIGDGELRDEIERTAHALGVGKRVVVLGFRNQSELPAIYGAGDVLVLASESETWGLVVNEGMAAGLAPVVSDRVGAGPDLVPHDWIYPAGDVAALGLLLEKLAGDSKALSVAKRQASCNIGNWGIDETADGVLKGVEAAVAPVR